MALSVGGPEKPLRLEEVAALAVKTIAAFLGTDWQGGCQSITNFDNLRLSAKRAEFIFLVLDSMGHTPEAFSRRFASLLERAVAPEPVVPEPAWDDEAVRVALFLLQVQELARSQGLWIN